MTVNINNDSKIQETYQTQDSKTENNKHKTENSKYIQQAENNDYKKQET